MKSGVKNVLCLTIITLVAGLALGYVYDVTKEPIKVMEEKTKQDAYAKVFEGAASFSEIDLNAEDMTAALSTSGYQYVSFDNALSALDAGGNTVGYVISVTSHEGYGGDISISVGINNEGTVMGVEILSISETAGLGMKAKEDTFRNQFTGKTVTQFSYTKQEPSADFEIEALSGATITTNAVTNAVNGALCIYEKIGGQI